MDEQALSELLECSVCLERLDHTSKVLPCQHTFCRRCLEEIRSTQHELRCPECRTLVTVRVEDLPPNILLVRLLEGLKTQSHVMGSKPSYRLKRDSSADSRQPHVTRTGWEGPQPCARAMFSYEASEKDDLSFKKGDLVTLRRQIDDNWFQGELKGQIGVFPASYVQVLVPLPQIPQCRALYDFQLDNEAEKDCLTFKKDQIINVIRKVDTNWIEGRKGDKIGILPLAFVELNHAAKMLISSKPPSLSHLHGSRHAPVTTATTIAVPTPTSSTLSSCPVKLSPHKRHSFTPKSDSPSPPPPVQRHSLELSGSGSDISSSGVAATTAAAPVVDFSAPLSLMVASMPAVLSVADGVSAKRSVSTADVTTSTGGQSSSTRITTTSPPSFSSVADSSAQPPTEVYVAMYNYRPLREDEVELLKGEQYAVTEKCQDGWFKGQCIGSGLSGVFPGNYVQLYRPSGFKPLNSNVFNIRAKVPPPHNHHHHLPFPSVSDMGSNSSPPIPPPTSKSCSVAPPLMPRVARISAPSVSSVSGPTLASKSTSSTQAPVTITAGRSSRSSGASSVLDPHHIGAAGAASHSSKHFSSSKISVGSGDAYRRTASPHAGQISVHHLMSPATNITPPNVVMGPAESSPLVSKDKKEKREKEKKSFVKLWPGKTKKSKSSASDAVPVHLGPDAIAHTRSGSYPLERSGPASPRESSQHRKTASLDSSTSPVPKVKSKSQPRERYRCIVPYPPQTEHELALEVGDIVLVHKRRDDGWFKGTQERTSKTGLFPGSFVEKSD